MSVPHPPPQLTPPAPFFSSEVMPPFFGAFHAVPSIRSPPLHVESPGSRLFLPEIQAVLNTSCFRTISPASPVSVSSQTPFAPIDGIDFVWQPLGPVKPPPPNNDSGRRTFGALRSLPLTWLKRCDSFSSAVGASAGPEMPPKLFFPAPPPHPTLPPRRDFSRMGVSFHPIPSTSSPRPCGPVFLLIDKSFWGPRGIL